MTIRNLDAMFKPQSVALIGAGKTPKTVGAVLVDNLINAGFPGELYFVNPKYAELGGHRCYPDIKSLPKAPDLALLATPPETTVEMIAELGARGTRAAVVITAGFGDGGGQRGKVWKQAMLDVAQPYTMRIMGPNCLGIMAPKARLNGSFGQVAPHAGHIAFVAQSGAILTAVLDWATSREIGFSHFVSMGDMVDVDFGDMLDYLAADYTTRAILLYIESITSSRKFMSAARAAARLKPVIVVKAGRYAEGARAAASHTGALAGVDAVYEAAFRRAGILRVLDMEALFNAVETLALAKPLSGDKLAILTNGGGVGVLATDTLIERGGHLASLAPETVERLNRVLPPMWSKTNPVDIIGDADGARYGEAMAILLEERNIDGILVMNCPTAITCSTESAQAVIGAVDANKSFRRPTILAGWFGDGSAREATRLFRKSGIPCYETPSDAVRGFMQMVRYQHSQEMLMQTVLNVSKRFTPNVEKVRTIIGRALIEQRSWLNEDEAKAVLEAYTIPVAPTIIAANPEEAAEASNTIHGPVVLKVLSPDIMHKSDMGGVALNLETPAEVLDAARKMADRFIKHHPGASLHGFTVQPMISRPNAIELIIGVFEDAQFGPVILFGHGGTAVEVIHDKALALPPLNMNLAREVMTHTRVYSLLQGYRNTPAADLDAIVLTLIKVSQLVCDFAEIKELDINPLLADAGGVIALDARIRIAAAGGEAAERLAIRPYPRELEQVIALPAGGEVLLRPIKPEDEIGFQEMFDSLPPEDIRMRFLHPMKVLGHKMAARLTQIDYDREMALVLEGQDSGGKAILLGAVRICLDPDNESAEFAILLRREVTGSGFGPMMLRRIIDYGRQRGLKRIFGDVLIDNSPMLKLARAFGFTVKPVHDDQSIRLVELLL